MFDLFSSFTKYYLTDPDFQIYSEDLSAQELGYILNSSCNKRESNQYFPAGTCIYKRDSSTNIKVTLSHSYLKIDKEIYQITNPLLKQGGQGSINEIAKLSSNTKRLAKRINASPNSNTDNNYAFLDALLEIEALKAAGLHHGHIIHIEPNADAPFLYQLQIFIIMDDLGEDLHTYLNREAPLSEFQQFDLAIQCFWLLAQCHMGLLFSSGKRIHRDLKPKNITIKNNKLSIIDWGLSQQIDSPNMQVVANRGSRPYIKFPVEEYMQDNGVSISQVPTYIWTSSKRSGELFDEDAMCKILYEPLCMEGYSTTRKGIFTDQTFHKYNLYQGINTFFDSINCQYHEERDITFRGAINRSVFLIAKQAKCSKENISMIINNQELALALIDIYVSNKEKWPTLGIHEISTVLAMSEQELKLRAFFVRVGLCGHVERALKDQHLYPLLTKDNNEDQQRAIACLFAFGLWQEPEVYVKKIKENDTLAARTLNAYFSKEDYELLKLYCREQIPSIAKEGTGKIFHILGEEIARALKHIMLEKEEIDLLLQHKEEVLYLYKFFNEIYVNKMPLQIHQVNIGVLIHLFATKTSYRKILMEFIELRHLSVLENSVKKHLRALIDLNFNFSNDFHKINLPAIKLDHLQKLFNHESKEFLKWIVEFHSEYSSIELKKILDIKQKNSNFYHLLFTTKGIVGKYFKNNKNQKVNLSKKILKEISLDSFFYDVGFESEKIQTLEALLTLPMPEHNNPFKNEALMKCGIIFQSQRLSLKENMPLMVEKKFACQVLAKHYDELYNGNINLSAYRLAKIYKNNQLYSMNLQANQWDLNFFITHITKLVDTDDKTKELLISLFINLYKQLSAFRNKLATFENRSSTLIRCALLLDQINNEIKSNLNTTPKSISSASFLSLLSTSINELKTFIDRQDVRNAIKNSNFNFQPFWFKTEASLSHLANKISDTLTKINKTLSSINNIDDENLIPIDLSHRVKPQNNNMSSRNNAKVFAWH